jgi:hypothetical protein
MTADPSATYDRLRAETAEMFDYDLASASLTQGLQIDLVSLLRLEIDTMSGRVLAGETVDLQRLVAAHGLLQKMLPAQALVAPAPGGGHDFAGARAELTQFLIKRANALERREQRESERLREENARLTEEIRLLRAARESEQQPPAPPPPTNVISIDGAARAKPPARYLKQREPWDSHDDGAIAVPAWLPD